MTVSFSVQRRRLFWQGLMLAAIFALSGLVVFELYNSVQRFLANDAKATARLWADAFLSQPELIEKVLNGRYIDHSDQVYFRTVARAGSVYKYKIYNAAGDLVYVSRDNSLSSVLPLRNDHPDDADKVLHGEAFVESHYGDVAAGEPEVYAEAYLPYMRDGEVLGVLSVYVDQTYVWNLARAEVGRLLMVILPIALLALLHTIYTITLLSRQNRNEAQIAHLAHHDPLTGVGNRHLFQTRLEQALPGRRDGDGHIALHLVDLDNFKLVNDTLGHDVGDLLLKAVARRLERSIRAGDIVARFGGDEFAVIQTMADSEEDARRLACRMVEEVRGIRDVGGIPVSVSLSVGVAVAPLHATTPIELQKCADIALYRAKSQGRDTAMVYEPGMEAELKERTLLRQRIRRAVEMDGFELHYQPLHDAVDGRVAGLECLIRMRDEAGGFVSPAVFIPMAEEMGLTRQIGRFVLNGACKAAVDWPEHVSIAVNLSAQQFEGDLVADVAAALAASGLPPHRLELEITETLLLAETDAVDRTLRALKAMGVRIVMDDFGTGYSSLSYLWKFPFDKLKVDRSCFASLGKTEGVTEILRTITAMSGAMHLRVVAEGIETDEQRVFAREAGYDELQGFIYSRPLERKDVAAYIAHGEQGGLLNRLRLAVSN